MLQIMLLRFIKAPSFLRSHLAQQTATYWRVRAGWRRASFYVSRALWKLRRAGKDAHEQGSLLLVIARAILLPTTISSVLVLALGVIDRNLTVRIGLRVIPSPPEPERFLTVALALAGIGGAFLGLYFTAISVVASTSYRDVPDDVRVAALNERMGMLYLQMVSILAAISIAMSIALVLGRNPGILNFVLLTLLGIVSIFGFVPLGKRAFSFLDPVRLGDSLGREILEAASLAGSKRHYREEPSFQAAYQRHAERSMATLENVVRVSLREAHNDSLSIRQLANHVAFLIIEYVRRKSTIPTDSLWFPRHDEFRSWLTTSGSHLKLALRTATQIQPKSVASRYWIEQRLTATIGDLIEALFRQGEHHAASTVLQTLLKTIEHLTSTHRFHEAHALSRRLATLKLERNPSTKGVLTLSHA